MDINKILVDKNITKYALSKQSGIPYACVSDICSGKARLENCNAGTIYKLAKTLDITIEDLLESRMEYRMEFAAYKSTVCHLVKDMGDLVFLLDVLESDKIRKLYNREWYPESLYLLAMVDYVSRENGIPLCTRYDDLRRLQFEKPIYPSGILLDCAVYQNDEAKAESFRDAIPEFRRHNIIENEVRNVC